MIHYCNETEYKSRKAVVEAYPSAAKIVKVCGGWAVFDFWNDYDVWKNQR